MRNFPTILYGCVLGTAALAAFAQGQQGAANNAKLPAPTVFPAPGTYFNTTALSLMDPVPGTEIHYTWDGSEPNASSPVFDPRGVLFIAGVYDGNQGLKTGYTLRAVSLKAGMTGSDPATFSYTIERRDRTTYVSEEIAPGVRMIRDSDNDRNPQRARPSLQPASAMGLALSVRLESRPQLAVYNALAIYCVYSQFLAQQSKRRVLVQVPHRVVP